MLRLSRTHIQNVTQALSKQGPYAVSSSTSSNVSSATSGLDEKDLANLGNPKKWIKLKQNQEFFQRDDGVPIHFKGGLVDKILFGTTSVLVVIGLVECGKFFYNLGWRRV